jgi:hypothetical protein
MVFVDKPKMAPNINVVEIGENNCRQTASYSNKFVSVRVVFNYVMLVFVLMV